MEKLALYGSLMIRYSDSENPTEKENNKENRFVGQTEMKN